MSSAYCILAYLSKADGPLLFEYFPTGAPCKSEINFVIGLYDDTKAISRSKEQDNYFFEGYLLLLALLLLDGL